MKETPLRWINRMLSSQTWIYLRPGETVEEEASYQQYMFDEDENKIYEVLPEEESPKKKKEKYRTRL